MDRLSRDAMELFSELVVCCLHWIRGHIYGMILTDQHKFCVWKSSSSPDAELAYPVPHSRVFAMCYCLFHGSRPYTLSTYLFLFTCPIRWNWIVWIVVRINLRATLYGFSAHWASLRVCAYVNCACVCTSVHQPATSELILDGINRFNESGSSWKIACKHFSCCKPKTIYGCAYTSLPDC